jgi:methylated-DNA-protein-cysteine methyltransferase-like protein
VKRKRPAANPEARRPGFETQRRIYTVVSKIPRGRVATYGQVARLAGMPGQARLVGYALSDLPDEVPVPWHRVVNAKGEISARSDGGHMEVIQRLLLKRERIRFDKHNRIALANFRWRPKS